LTYYVLQCLRNIGTLFFILFSYFKSTTEDPRATYTVGGTQRCTNIRHTDTYKKRKNIYLYLYFKSTFVTYGRP